MTLYTRDAWWHDLNKLREKTDALYVKLGRDIWQTTAEKMIELRGWSVKESALIPILQELQVYYVPKRMIPGPMFVFPEYDAAGRVTRAQTKPLHTLFGETKYYTLGVKKELFLGPVWLGNTDATLAKILEMGFVILVEGPFDLIAARIVAPDLPIMSSLTKSIGDQHEAYLKILGIKRLCLLFDNEVSEAGETSMKILRHVLGKRGLKVEIMPPCPGGDPAYALKSPRTKKALHEVLYHCVDE